MGHHGSSWVIVCHRGLSWVIVGIVGNRWLSCIIMGSHGLLRTFQLSITVGEAKYCIGCVDYFIGQGMFMATGGMGRMREYADEREHG